MLSASFPERDLPANRVVVVDDHDLFTLAGPSDANYVGFVQPDDDDGERIVVLRGGAHELTYPSCPLAGYRQVRPRSSPFVLLQRAPGEKIVTGQPVYVAAEGRIAGAGEVRCGIAAAWLAGDLFVVLPS